MPAPAPASAPTLRHRLEYGAFRLLDGGKYLVQIRSSELSRARGGPRCMTMPLSREGR